MARPTNDIHRFPQQEFVQVLRSLATRPLEILHQLRCSIHDQLQCIPTKLAEMCTIARQGPRSGKAYYLSKIGLLAFFNRHMRLLLRMHLSLEEAQRVHVCALKLIMGTCMRTEINYGECFESLHKEERHRVTDACENGLGGIETCNRDSIDFHPMASFSNSTA